MWDLQRRFIDTGIDLADRDRDKQTPDAFKWTIETTAPLLKWLKETSEEELIKFSELEEAGRIEVTGMLANITPLYGPAQTFESLNPMVQFGDFHFGDDQDEFDLERALFLGWVTNNYWDTNFRAHQPGQVSARYHLTPHDGSFDESFAHRKGFEAEHTTPLAQTMGEPLSDPRLPAHGCLPSGLVYSPDQRHNSHPVEKRRR